ncbi:exonuclease domain-containing protein [Granulosicoccus antarcticus]|uniref:DNA polymerase III PolC-type n=1 Tax=Granulosicoccus antarcticus IMCC3135 TaxID=1192854 RepID=A0A2Z2NPD1_9GAMM|nr:exonuclease domain-containing protein [Granulosicoccus antarcticus]ASJ73119.1 DNA polymerase III PolC-type [Granulosicoccus antarcticus IMCC3135]
MRIQDRAYASFACRRMLSLEQQRRRWLKCAPAGALRDYYQVPFAKPDTLSSATRYLALDIETTGLVPQRDELLSIGFVPIYAHELRLSGARHYLVRPEQAIPESSAIVHGILDDRAREGLSLAEALPPLLQALAGHVLVAHSARIEHDFLDIACRRLYGCAFVTPMVDTLELEQRKILRAGSIIAPGSLRLDALRQQYGLPRYRAHDALSDAIGAGELLLAHIAHRTNKRPLRLNELTRSY